MSPRNAISKPTFDAKQEPKSPKPIQAVVNRNSNSVSSIIRQLLNQVQWNHKIDQILETKPKTVIEKKDPAYYKRLEYRLSIEDDESVHDYVYLPQHAD